MLIPGAQREFSGGLLCSILRLMKRSILFASLLFFAVASQQSRSENIPPGRPGIPRLPGELEIHAMAEAYPERVEEIGVRSGQWALRMDGEWYYWAEGRLLPREQKELAEEFVSIRFYGSYRFGPAIERELSPELEARLRERSNLGARDRRTRFNGFLDKLYRVGSEAEAEAIMERVEFFGHSTRVHPMVVEPLARVEERLRRIALEDPGVESFVAELRELHGYNWRNIAGTNRRSYHSYGIAVDLLPRSYRGRWAYWLWAAQSGSGEWWNLPVAERWKIPQPVIDTFEREGFVWGGKWLFFDNIHFEYRPESIILARWRWVDGFPGSWLREPAE